ncbi:MAG: Gldg family protein [Verrucomicrobiae bacterium]|nr:Gldg family protein [Verrucomicrobiae bacterium]
MKHKKLETALYSAAGVAVVFAALVAVNVIAGAFKVRLDMTTDKVFTLSPGTKAILKRLDAPVEVRFYFSRSEKNLPSWAPNFARNVEDLLAEFQQHARGNLIVRKFDPRPDSDAEDLAVNDGIERQVTPDGAEFFLGIAVSLDPLRVAIPALVPARERLLEYDLARAIARVLTTNKPVVGVMSPLPLFGQAAYPMMPWARQGQRPWVAITELQHDFTVRQINMDADKIDDDVQVLVVVQPRGISEKTLFAIDQFVLRGGRLLALLDATCIVDRPPTGNPVQQMLPGGGSSLEPLLKAWGVSFENNKVVADLNFARELSFQEGGRPQLMPTWLFITSKGINQNDIVTSQIDNLLFPSPGAFVGSPANGVKKTVLVHSTRQSQLVDGISAQFGGQDIAERFKPSGIEYELAVRLQGRFKTAFPDGPPGEAGPDAEKRNSATEGKKDDKSEPAKEQKKTDWLKESQKETAVVLIGDSDFIYDSFCVRMLPVFGLAQPINGNLNFFQNIVEQLAGDSNLISVRSRATIFRPFTRVQEKEAVAQQRFRNEIARLQAELEETQRQLNELQGKKEPGQRFFLSREQQEKIAEVRRKEAETRRNLKQVRKDLRREIDSLEARLKWINIAGMPLLVSLAGLVIAYVHRQRTRAR